MKKLLSVLLLCACTHIYGQAPVIPVPYSYIQMFEIEHPSPPYPAIARETGVQGEVIVRIHINKDGDVDEAKVVRGPLLLVTAALETAKKWTYRPIEYNSQIVDATTLVHMYFVIEN